MAIRIIDGNPGSGKTYYLVKFLRDNYYDKTSNGYVAKTGYTVISNIDDLKLPHLNLNELVEKYIGKGEGSADKFFEYTHQQNLTDELSGSLVYAIDEAQRFWRSGDKTKTQNLAYEYFEMHRHLGHDVFLCTQESSKLPRHITSLPEFIINAAPRSRSIIGEFRYYHTSDGLTVNTENLVKDKDVFNLYKSMDRAETVKIKNPLIPKIILLCALALAMVLGGMYYIYNVFTPSDEKSNKSSSQVANTAPITNKDLIDVPVSTCTLKKSHNGILSVQTYYVVVDIFYPEKDFPYKIRDAGLVKYASVPRSLLPAKKNDSEKSIIAGKQEQQI